MYHFNACSLLSSRAADSNESELSLNSLSKISYKANKFKSYGIIYNPLRLFFCKSSLLFEALDLFLTVDNNLAFSLCLSV